MPLPPAALVEPASISAFTNPLHGLQCKIVEQQEGVAGPEGLML